MSIDPSTIVAHDDDFPAGAVVPPIFQTSLFTFGSYGELEGDKAAVRRFCDALGLFRLGVSWGGHESLAFPAAAGLEQKGEANPLRAFGVAPGTIRLHIGLEDPSDLWSDLSQALDRC